MVSNESVRKGGRNSATTRYFLADVFTEKKRKIKHYAFVILVNADRMSFCRRAQSHGKRGLIVPSCIILHKRLSLSHTWCEQKEGFNLLSHTLSPKTIKHINENKSLEFPDFPHPIRSCTLNLITSGIFSNFFVTK